MRSDDRPRTPPPSGIIDQHHLALLLSGDFYTQYKDIEPFGLGSCMIYIVVHAVDG